MEGYYYLYNAHGDVTALIDKSSSISATYDYDAFGTILSESGIADNPIRYVGYQNDKERDLYYLNARYYDSKIARFLTEDTYRGQQNDPLSLNLYTYCSNNPIIYFDPSGHHWQQGDETLNNDTMFRIIGLTSAYYATTSQGVRDVIDIATAAIRKDPSSMAKRDTLVDLPKKNDFLNAISIGLECGYIRKNEWEAGMKALGATVTTSVEVKTTAGAILTIKSTNTIVGKSEMNVTIKDARSVNNPSIRSIGLNEELTTHYSAYVFYLPEWKKEKDPTVKELSKYFKIDKSDIGTASVTNSAELSSSWNMMGLAEGDKNISAVVINTHADAMGLSFNNKKEMSGRQISDLEDKDVDNLILLGCNAGHLDYKESNPAANFSKKINDGRVMATDGTNEYYKQFNWFGKYIYKSIDDNTFRRNLTGSRSNNGKQKSLNEGWIIYQYKDAKVEVSDSYGRKLHLRKMLKHMK